MSHLRYFITFPQTSEREYFPQFNGKFITKRENNQAFYRTNLSGDLVFNTRADWDAFEPFLADAVQRCRVATIRISQLCDDGQYGDKFLGKFAMANASVDQDNCIVTLKPRINDVYECVFDGWGADVNTLDVADGPNLSVDTTNAGYELGECTSNAFTCGTALIAPDTCITVDFPPTSGWRYYGQSCSGDLVDKHLFFREKVTSTCSGGTPIKPPQGGGNPWILLTHNCPTDSTYVRIPTAEYPAQAHTFKRTKSLEDIGVKLANEACPTITGIVSDFFQINPENPSTNNYVTGSDSNVDEIYFVQKSDAKRPDSSEEATLQKWNLKEFLEALRVMFNVYWHVDNFGKLHLEHISFYENTNNILDLTSTSPERLVGTNKFSFSTDVLPLEERFLMKEQVSEDFVGLPIYYRNSSFARLPCVGDDAKTHQIDDISTEVNQLVGVMNNPFASEDSISNAGWMVLSADGTTVRNSTGKLSGLSLPNGSLSWANLHFDFHKHNRAAGEGFINGVHQTFESSERTKAQDGIVAVGCSDCEPFQIQYQPPNVPTVTTGLGNGEVGSIEHDLIKGIKTYNLKHD